MIIHTKDAHAVKEQTDAVLRVQNANAALTTAEKNWLAACNSQYLTIAVLYNP